MRYSDENDFLSFRVYFLTPLFLKEVLMTNTVVITVDRWCRCIPVCVSRLICADVESHLPSFFIHLATDYHSAVPSFLSFFLFFFFYI